MTRELFTAAMIAVASISAASAGDFNSADIAALPQDKVVIIKQHCASRYPENFEMRVFCEDQQFSALKQLIQRGSIKPQEDKQ
jgi:hypothetical protein